MKRTLTPAQLYALLDILTHYDTYAEIRDFRKPGALKDYGPPFSKEAGRKSTSPALQALISRFILDLPGLRDVPPEFWTVQVHELIEQLEHANLSESYDKGSVGSRKTLSTAVSALLEYPVRGTFGGFAEVDADEDHYDLHSAEDVARGFRDFIDQCVYGTALEDLVKKAGETDALEDHTKSTKAVHEFVLVNLASFMHYTLILSPKGQYLLRLVDNANKLIPYLAIRQTLRIGNIATMLSAIVRLVLAKMSVASLTNWIGLTDTQDDGMNLLQQIISTVLAWDVKDLESRLSRIEKDKNCPSKEVRIALDDYADFDREKQHEIRRHSQSSSTSIVLTILADAGKASDMRDETHSLAVEYLSCRLSIRDRDQITKVACHSHPDHLTTMVRSLFTAYEPVIRQFHDAVNLSDTVADFQAFVTDMLKVAKIPDQTKDNSAIVPNVGDFVQLLRRHQYSFHKFIHQLCKNGKDVVRWYLDWAKQSAANFRRESDFVDATEEQDTEHAPQLDKNWQTTKDAGDLNEALHKLFEDLPEDKKADIVPILDQILQYVDEMHSSSMKRLSDVLNSQPTQQTPSSTLQKLRTLSRPSSRPSSRSSSPVRDTNNNRSQVQQKSPSSASRSKESDVPKITSDPGPGAYLARWQDLLDATPITPLTPYGKPVRASDKVVVQASAKDMDGGRMVDLTSNHHALDSQKVKPSVPGGGTNGKEATVKKPDVKVVVDSLSEAFRNLLAERACSW